MIYQHPGHLFPVGCAPTCSVGNEPSLCIKTDASDGYIYTAAKFACLLDFIEKTGTTITRATLLCRCRSLKLLFEDVRLKRQREGQDEKRCATAAKRDFGADICNKNALDKFAREKHLFE